MKPWIGYTIAALAVCLGANAATLTGTVRNGTTGSAAAGDDVVLLMAGRAAEAGRTKTDRHGRFRFALGDSRGGVVRVIHQGLAYHSPARSGALEIVVYEVAGTTDGLFAAWNARIQTEADTLQVIEEIKVRNASNPPQAVMSPLEIQLPPEAEVLAGKVQLAGGKPIALKPAAGSRKGQYVFRVPLLPGEGRFAVAYRLPYTGQAVIEPRISYPLTEVEAVLPRSMRFEMKTGDTFRPVAGAVEANRQVVAAAVESGRPPAFRISGTGNLAAASAPPPPAQAAANPRAPHNNRDRWLLLGSVALVLASGGAGSLAHRRKRKTG